MKTVTKTALANVKQNKGRNFLCGCAIALTTFLIFVVLTVGYGMIRVQLASVDAYYPTYHIMFRQVSEKNTKALQVSQNSLIVLASNNGDFGSASTTFPAL